MTRRDLSREKMIAWLICQMILFFMFSMFLLGVSRTGAEAEALPAVQLPERLTVEEALRLFRAYGLDLLIAEAAIDSAEGDLRIAGSIQNPNWTAGMYQSYFSPGLFESDRGWFFGIGDSAAVFDALSGKRSLRLKVARSALQSTKLARVDVQRNLEFALKQQYIQTVLARNALIFSLDVQKSMTQTFELTQTRYKAGAISEADEARIEVAKLEADQAVRLAEQALRTNKVALAFLLGVREVVPDYDVEQSLPKYLVPSVLSLATVSSLVGDAFSNRPDLKSQDYQRDRAEASIRLAKRLRFPDVSLNLQYSQEGSSHGKEITNASPIAPLTPPTIQLSISSAFPIFYQQQGEIQKAKADLRTQDLQYNKLRAQVISDVETAHANFITTQGLVETMEGRLLDRAQRARDLTEFQYKKGAASLLDFLDAQRTYIATNIEYLQDLTNYWIAVFQLEQAVGMELNR